LFLFNIISALVIDAWGFGGCKLSVINGVVTPAYAGVQGSPAIQRAQEIICIANCPACCHQFFKSRGIHRVVIRARTIVRIISA